MKRINLKGLFRLKKRKNPRVKIFLVIFYRKDLKARYFNIGQGGKLI